jgi:hypothetical protein
MPGMSVSLSVHPLAFGSVWAASSPIVQIPASPRSCATFAGNPSFSTSSASGTAFQDSSVTGGTSDGSRRSASAAAWPLRSGSGNGIVPCCGLPRPVRRSSISLKWSATARSSFFFASLATSALSSYWALYSAHSFADWLRITTVRRSHSASRSGES